MKHHPLVDGNKRLGWLATAVFLDINGVSITSASNTDVYALVIDVAAGDRTIGEIAAALRRLPGVGSPKSSAEDSSREHAGP